MSKIFNETCNLVERIPTMELVTHFFWSVMHEALCPEDREKVVESLIDRVTEQNNEGQNEQE